MDAHYETQLQPRGAFPLSPERARFAVSTPLAPKAEDSGQYVSSKELEERCEARTAEGNLSIAQLTYEQVTELSLGRVPAEIQELAKTLVDWTFEDLRRNAAKPIRLATTAKRAHGRHTKKEKTQPARRHAAQRARSEQATRRP